MPQNRYGEHGRKQKPLHKEQNGEKQNHCIGTLVNMANSVLKAIHTMCSYLGYLFQCILFTLFTYNKMKERCTCVCAMCEFIYHC